MEGEVTNYIKKLLPGVIVLVVIFYFLFQLVMSITPSDGVEASDSSNSAPAKWATWDGEGEPPKAYIVVVTGGGERNAYITSSANIYGQAYNRTGKKLSYIQISYGIYNESGAKVGSCLANESNLSAETAWEFSALCTNLPSGNVNYKVDDVAYW